VNACDRFLTELDALGPDGVEVAHAATCPGCARALSAARAIEAQLAGTPATAPSGFTDRVLARVRAEAVAATHTAPAVAPVAFRDVLPEWVRLAAEPRVAGAMTLAALLMAFGPRLLVLGRAGLFAAAAWLTGGVVRDIAPLMRPFTALAASDNLRLALECAALTMLMLIAVPLYRWSERLTRPRRH